MKKKLFFAMTLTFYYACAQAHGVVLWAEIINNWVEVKAYDSQGKPVTHGQIIVRDLAHTVIHTGRLDQNGSFAFLPAFISDLVISVNQQQKHTHASEFLLTVQDFHQSHLELLSTQLK